MNFTTKPSLQYLRKIPLAILTIFAVLNCQAQDKKKPVNSDSLAVAGNFSRQETSKFDPTALDTFFVRFPLLSTYQRTVKDFYQKRNFAYAWYDKQLLIEQAQNLSNRVVNLKEDGIDQKAPYFRVLDSLVNGIRDNQKLAIPDPTTELMLTAQYFLFSKLAWHGQDDSVSKAAGWFIPRKKIAYAKLLDSLLDESNAKDVFQEPVYRQYELLKSFLKKYRKLAAKPWPILLNRLKPLKPGDSAAVILQIKMRLSKLGDYSGSTFNTRYDQQFIGALKRFQQRHGLKEDGLLGPNTIEQLNRPLSQRITQIIINMERCRWLPVSSDGDYLAVNIPEYKLHVYHRDSLQWSSNVVVGQTWNSTTVFSGIIENVVFSPYWNLPESIVRKEVLPGIEKDADYLNKHDMEITRYNGSLPSVRQRPGPRNSLGMVKFLFPNSYSIYIHDTPAKSLFGETERAFSHGCIRVMEPLKLATFLLANQTEWTVARIDAAMKSGKEKYVPMKKKVPVYIAYLTAFCDRDNVLNFRNDIYNLDEAMATSLIYDH